MASDVIDAFLWGAAGASALLVGSAIAYAWAPSRTVIAIVMAVGTGVLIGSVSFELVEDALASTDVVWVATLVLAGAAVFTIGDWMLDRRGGSMRKDPMGAQAEGEPLAIVLGSVLDGIPESFVLGLTVLQGGVSPSLFAGIVLSNLPEGMASSSGLRVAGWKRAKVFSMWAIVVVASGLSAALGAAVLDDPGGRGAAAAQSFAAGALLAMLADTLLPEAYAVEGVLTGSLVVAGFAASLGLQAL